MLILVTISGGELPVIVPPPTPTPRVTPTIDPTLAAQLIIEIGPTRLPTFTQPPRVGNTDIHTSTSDKRCRWASDGIYHHRIGCGRVIRIIDLGVSRTIKKGHEV